jgi:hypothetical protein
MRLPFNPFYNRQLAQKGNKQMKTMLVFAMILMPVIAFAGKPKQTVKVEVVHTNTVDIKHNPGFFRGVQTKNLVFSMNTVVNGEHVKLECKEGNRVVLP